MPSLTSRGRKDRRRTTESQNIQNLTFKPPVKNLTPPYLLPLPAPSRHLQGHVRKAPLTPPFPLLSTHRLACVPAMKRGMCRLPYQARAVLQTRQAESRCLGRVEQIVTSGEVSHAPNLREAISAIVRIVREMRVGVQMLTFGEEGDGMRVRTRNWQQTGMRSE